MESRADRRTSHALHTVTTHDHASDRPGYFIGELRLSATPDRRPPIPHITHDTPRTQASHVRHTRTMRRYTRTMHA